MIHKTTRSILSVLLAALLLVTSIPLTPAFADGGTVSPQSESAEGRALEGEGTAGNPYQIATANDLREFAKLVNGTDGNSADPGAHAKLMNDIVLNEKIEVDENGAVTNQKDLSEWTPIGNEEHLYTGTFNGDGHKIENLYINTTDSGADNQGLFGYVGTRGTVQNLSVSGSVKGNDYVGGVVGYNNGGTVTGCIFSGSGSVSGGSYVGGVVGLNSSGIVKNCTNTGEVSGPDSGYTNAVGGVVGHSSSASSGSASVTNCYNTGSVNGSIEAGGVVGVNGGNVENCYNIGDVSGKISVGGVVGWNRSSVINCYNTGSVSDGTYTGGVVGYNHSGGTVTDCYFLKGTAGSGIGSDEAIGATAEPVDNLDELCKKFKDTTTWSIHPVLGRPVLNENREGGLGTDKSPYEISTATQLKNFRDIVNGKDVQAANPNAHAKLMNNINLNGNATNQWTPIGNEEHLYTGTFNGNGHTISGLTINNRSAEDQGLFGYLSTDGINTGTVQNLTVSGSVSGGWYVGGIVGYNFFGTVTNCAFSGSVTGSYYVGGVVGQNFGTVENCYNTDAVNSSGNRVGGVVGDNGGTVKNCYNTGTVTGPDSGSDSYVGGVVGNNEASVTNCYNTGKVTGSADSSDVGGVVGLNSSGDSSASASVTNCYNTGKVTGSADSSDVGGVVGHNSSASVANCYYQTGKGAAVGIGGTTGDNSSQTAAKSLEDFHSGEVAYLLEKGVTDEKPVWGQDLTDKNSLPTLIALDKNAKTVYQVTLKYDHAGEQDKTYYTDDTATPSEQPSRDGYTFDHWDKTEGEGNTITYTAKWIEATPEPTPDPEPEEPPYTGKYSYEVSTSVGDNGTVTVDRYATEGDEVTIIVTPDEAYKLDDLSVTANGKDVELTANDDGTYSFTMPSADVRITATFAEDPDWTPDEPEEPTTDVSDLFIDIAPDAWYKDAVQYAYDNGLMTGVSATEFAPEATTTRAMIVSILARLEGVTTAQAAGFADVDDNDWYATAVNWAANVGVVNGYEDNTFQPNTAITREQLAAILMNYAAYKGYDVSARADLSHYSDADSISSWANDVLLWAVAEGLLTGVTDDTIAPQAHATRAQVAAILQRFLSE